RERLALLPGRHRPRRVTGPRSRGRLARAVRWPKPALASCVPRRSPSPRRPCRRLELISFLDGDLVARRTPGPPSAGLFQLSFFVDVEATLMKLAALGLGGTP